HRTEECGEVIKVVLAPLLVRVMMATGAFETRAEEELAEQRGQVSRLAAVTINDRGTIAMVRALGKEDFTHELVVRLVLPETLPQPLVESEHAFHADAIGVGAQQIAPLVRPVIGVLGSREEAVNQCAACGGRTEEWSVGVLEIWRTRGGVSEVLTPFLHRSTSPLPRALA